MRVVRSPCGRDKRWRSWDEVSREDASTWIGWLHAEAYHSRHEVATALGVERARASAGIALRARILRQWLPGGVDRSCAYRSGECDDWNLSANHFIPDHDPDIGTIPAGDQRADVEAGGCLLAGIPDHRFSACPGGSHHSGDRPYDHPLDHRAFTTRGLA